MLLTTEEILTQNKFWFCLDRIWIVEELEPFEDVPFHQVYHKPISRDIYYSRYPDIPKSESEDETSLTLSGFSGKYHDWKSKIYYRKYMLRKRSCSSLGSWDRFNGGNFKTKRVTSLVNCYEEIQKINNDDKVRAFFNRLLESIPPPPLEKFEKIKPVSCSLILHQKCKTDILNLQMPNNYEEFESVKLKQTTDGQNLAPATSTLKKNRIDFESSNLKGGFEDYESWNDSIFGIDVMTCEKAVPETTVNNECNYLSWSEIIDECGVNDSIIRQESGVKKELKTEEILSKYTYNSYMSELSDCEDEEQRYAKFAVYKIYKTLSLGNEMTDSSSLNDFSKIGEDFNHRLIQSSNSSFYGQVYRITLLDDLDLASI